MHKGDAFESSFLSTKRIFDMATAGFSLSFFTIVWVEIIMSQNEVKINSAKQFLSLAND